MADPFMEKRREPRLAAEGSIRIRPIDPPGARAVDGHLVDISDSGFRASHACRTLQAGHEVEFLHEKGRGRARVVWMRILADSVESGFYVTSRP